MKAKTNTTQAVVLHGRSRGKTRSLGGKQAGFWVSATERQPALSLDEDPVVLGAGGAKLAAGGKDGEL